MILTPGAGNNLSKAVIQATPLRRMATGNALPRLCLCSHQQPPSFPSKVCILNFALNRPWINTLMIYTNLIHPSCLRSNLFSTNQISGIPRYSSSTNLGRILIYVKLWQPNAHRTYSKLPSVFYYPSLGRTFAEDKMAARNQYSESQLHGWKKLQTAMFNPCFHRWWNLEIKWFPQDCAASQW